MISEETFKTCCDVRKIVGKTLTHKKKINILTLRRIFHRLTSPNVITFLSIQTEMRKKVMETNITFVSTRCCRKKVET
jgi:hypothetical protein